jgi:hypothetical protein
VLAHGGTVFSHGATGGQQGCRVRLDARIWGLGSVLGW